MVLPADGLNLWVPLQQASQPVVFGLARRGWLARVGDGFRVGDAPHGLRITVSGLDEAEVQRLAYDIRLSQGGR
ncbi:hypothetical protein [Xylophilus sp.]|uniref:hypothetical protein n=1 Tax=Xylophilus sp. TaxID=2653893 RepID=UPI0013BB7099|nr:hypothetical protein [Xylophilus sp.]KAF1047535.1 MAG: Vitamin B6 salvage pathway transcriptional repressor PtsJ [Xylophilus sp.]